MLKFTGERIVPEADNCEPNFAKRMYQEHIARYMFAAQLCKGKRILDLGCGIGYGSQFLAQHGARRVLAVDLSEEAINHGRQFYSHPNIEFRQGDAETFAVDETFDLVTCFEVIEHVRDQPAVMETIRKALAPGGVMVMSTPRPYEEMRSEFHVHELEEPEFRTLIGAVFENQEYYFENMHFCSIVADHALDRINIIKYLEPDLTLSNCDILMVVASNAPIPKERLEGVLVVNDDRYVTMLERDVSLLHEAEDLWQRKIKNLEEYLARAEKKHDDLFLSSVARHEYEELHAKHQELLGSTVSREDYDRLFLSSVSRTEYEALHASTVSRTEYEALHASTVPRTEYEALFASTVKIEEYHQLESQLNLADGRRTTAELALQAAADEMSAIKAAAIVAAEELQKKQTELTAMLQYQNQTEDALQQTRDALRQTEDARAASEDRADALSGQLAEWQRLVQLMQGSWSWRLTRPLRGLRRAMRGRRT